MSLKSKYGPGGEFDPDWSVDRISYPHALEPMVNFSRAPSKRNLGRGPPPPTPPPEPPKVAKPGWRTVHPRPSRKTQKENRFSAPQPPSPPRPPPSTFYPSSGWGDTAWDGTTWGSGAAWGDTAWGLREKEHEAPFPPSQQSHKEVTPWTHDVKTRESDANDSTAPTALALLPSTRELVDCADVFDIVLTPASQLLLRYPVMLV